MAKKSNVHPDYYKTAGREPVGQGSVQELEKQLLSKFHSEEKLASDKKRKRKFPTRKTADPLSRPAKAS